MPDKRGKTADVRNEVRIPRAQRLFPQSKPRASRIWGLDVYISVLFCIVCAATTLFFALNVITSTLSRQLFHIVTSSRVIRLDLKKSRSWQSSAQSMKSMSNGKKLDSVSPLSEMDLGRPSLWHATPNWTGSHVCPKLSISSEKGSDWAHRWSVGKLKGQTFKDMEMQLERVSRLELDFSKLRFHKTLAQAKGDEAEHDPRARMNGVSVALPSFIDFPIPRQSNYDIHNRAAVWQGNSLLVFRKDDHNPFFQVSLAYDAWIFATELRKRVKWPEFNRVVFMDEGGEHPSDSLIARVVLGHAPMKRDPRIVYADRVSGKVHLSEAWILSSEYSGPLTIGLNAQQVWCEGCSRLTKFVADSLRLFDLPTQRVSPVISGTSQKRRMTVVTRQNYAQRKLGRIWQNERECVSLMRQEWSEQWDIQRVDLARLSWEQQMRIASETDLWLGMHGAGHIHILWLPRTAFVVEIFPKNRRRFTYRNIAKMLRLRYKEFRGGSDGKMESKRIPCSQWIQFIRPIVRQTEIQTSVNNSLV